MLEKGIGFSGIIKDFKTNVSPQNIGAGLIATIFGLAAGAVHIGAGTANGLPTEFIIMWVTSLYLINGVFGVIMSAVYRKPIPMANSLPGALLFAAAIPMVGLGPTLGAALIAGVLTALIGMSGAMEKLMRFTPMPIVMGMIGGVLLKFGLNLVTPLKDFLLPVSLMIIAYLIATKFISKFPAVVASLIVGIAILIFSGADFSNIEFAMEIPKFVMPSFSLEAFLVYGLPLTIILCGMETPVGVGILKAVGYKNVPTNAITFANGIGTIIGSFFNLHSTAIAAPMAGICSSPDAGEMEGRWISSFITGLFWVICAPFYGLFVKLFQVTPPYFVSVIAGLALIKVLSSTIGSALAAPKHKMGAIFAFLISASGITLYGIGSSFWGLLIGIMISLFVETKDFDFVGAEN
ncbi:benzoate/H(+) symporter BenE family transporter [Alkalibacter mobilis]|uniref:benzoate/H(+) symporter BenE family transporter n=1 Tax=Alkalibacter mobilis TaxID=2787712 RepID=UPI0018A0CD9F|nr:benzoate/H(+) symporter BenE family transporter [Alkalibacter mobilis]MBF7097505.1 benzoate/H(+) symporter BenE family transporter [Alkalibacter mobilis]